MTGAGPALMSWVPAGWLPGAGAVTPADSTAAVTAVTSPSVMSIVILIGAPFPGTSSRDRPTRAVKH